MFYIDRTEVGMLYSYTNVGEKLLLNVTGIVGSLPET